MEKKKIVISSITVAVLLVLVVASSYAYFQARIASGGQTSTSVGAKTLDSFAINKGNDISLIANQDNFALGKGDLSSSTTATVTFTARNDEASSYAYDVGFYIKKNTFEDSGIRQQKTGSEDKGLGIVNFENQGNITYTESLAPTYGNWNPNDVVKRKTYIFQYNDKEFDFSGRTYDFIFEVFSEDERSINDFDFNIELWNRRYTESSCDASSHYALPTITGKEKINTLDGKIYYKITVTMPEDISIPYGKESSDGCGLYNYIRFSSGFNSDGGGGYYENIRIIDKSSTLGQSYTTLPYVQGYESELELTIKKNGEVLGTYDITNTSSDDYIYFKERDEDAAYDVFIDALNQCMLSGLVQIDSVKYATIEACGDDLGCGMNAYQEIVNACNGDEECENLLQADVYQLYPYCEEKARIEYIKYIGYGISANAGATTTDTWEATVTFKNLDGNQNINVGKSFEGYFYFDSVKDYTVNYDGFLVGGILKNNGIIE